MALCVRLFTDYVNEKGTNMTNELRLDTIADFLALTPAQFERMLPDFSAWHAFSKLAIEAGAESSKFIWIDDGQPGNISAVSVTIKETGEVMEFEVTS